jgi:hypothetical protein
LQLYADGGYQLRIRSLEGTPNYGPRHIYTFDNVSFIWYKCMFLILLVPRLRLMCFHEYLHD